MEEFFCEFRELKQAYLDVISDKLHMKRVANEKVLQHYLYRWKRGDPWSGASSDEMINWLHNGYVQPGLNLEPPIEPVRKRRRIQYGEEGELQLDLAWSGHDYPFLSWTHREVMPGMNVQAYFSFVYSTPASIIVEYERWLLRALIALETAGLDLSVSLYGDHASFFVGKENHIPFRSRIIVKKEGEQTDFISWSAMFSPGGFRHLQFLQYIMGADAVNKSTDTGLGHGLNIGFPWSVSYDPDTQTLDIKTPFQPRSFPEEEMDIQLRTVLSEARRAA